LSQELNKLQAAVQQENKAKEEKITQLQLQVEKFKGYPKVGEFRKEALEVTKALSRQLNILCHKISLVDPLCIITASLIEHAVDTRLEFADDKLTKFLSWQSSEEGMAENLPKIQESHKEILFLEWQSQLIKVERATSRARATMNSAIEL